MKNFVLILLLGLVELAMPAAAAVPSQFAKLMNGDTTDYTLNNSIWTTPTLPNFGACSNDATWKTASCRVPIPTDCSSGNCATTSFLNDYSKTVPWSVDNQYFITMDTGGWLYLYKVNSGVYTFVRLLQSAGANYGSTRDNSNGQGMTSDPSNWVWANNSTTPHTVYYTGSSVANSNRIQLKAYNVDTDSISVIHDFSSTISSVAGCVAIDDQREGNGSEDDRYWAFSCIGSGGDNDTKSVLVYDRQADSVLAVQPLTSGGLCGTSACPSTPNWVGMSPAGDYVLVNWNVSGHDASWTRGYGTEAYHRDLSFAGAVESSNFHADVGYDINGNEVYVTVPDAPTDDAYNEIAICNLANVSPTKVGSVANGGCQKAVQLPCSYQYAGTGYVGCSMGSSTFRTKGYTISMRATQGSGMGWMLLSTMDGGTTSTGVGGWAAMENVAIQIDWNNASSVESNASVVPSATFVRLGRTHSIGGSHDYPAQPNGVPNKTFTKYGWTSNWDTVTSNWGGPYYSMYTELASPGTASPPPPTPPTVTTPTASFTDTTNGLTATFTDTSTDVGGSIVSRAWNFGDGATSSLTNPSHIYAAAGSYSVVLTVTDSGGASATSTQSTALTAPPVTTPPVTPPPTTPPPTPPPVVSGSNPCTDFYSAGFALAQGELVVPAPPLAKPTKGAAFSEPSFHTCVVRATDHAADGVSGYAVNDDSRRQSFNADDSRFIVTSGDGTWYLYDANSLQKIAALNGPSGNAEPQWHPTNPDILYYLPTNGGTQIYALDVSTNSSTLAADLSGELPFAGAAHVWTHGAGSPSSDGRYWGFQVEDANFNILGLMVWDMLANRVVGSTPITTRPDNVSMSPSGRWLVSSASDGVYAWSPDFSVKKPLYTHTENADLAIGANGDDVFVSIDYQSAGGDVFMVDIDTGVRKELFATYLNGATSSMDFSGKAYASPGWVLVSAFAGTPSRDGSTPWFEERVFTLQLAANPQVFELAAHRSTYNGAVTQPYAATNHDLTRVLFNSNWGGSDPTDMDAYMIQLPANTPSTNVVTSPGVVAPHAPRPPRLYPVRLPTL
jgi:PKD repeat protein